MTSFTEVPGFSCRYMVQLEPDLLGVAGEVHRFGPTDGHGRNEYLVRVCAAGGEWHGAFRGGDGGVTLAISTPSPDHFFLSVAGQGYWVDTQRPAATEPVVAYPVRAVKAIPEAGALVCVDDTDMLLFDRSGAKWASRRIASDGLRITKADARGVWGRAWDAVADKEVGFFVDLTTGAVEGGLPDDR